MALNRNKLIGIHLIMLGLAIGGLVLVRSTIYAPDTELTPPTEPQLVASTTTEPVITPTSTPPVKVMIPGNYPVKLQVSSANVDAKVQYVGLKADQSMANPSNFTDVGWYKLGTIPGKVGSAVIAGHVDNALALSGVFKHLSDTKVGDDVYVTRKDGTKLHFVVDDVEYYPYKEAPNVEIFTSHDGKAHLNLVTCAGIWVSVEHSYTQRLVIYTTLVE